MDQLKAFGHWMKKNYFWVICGLVALLAPASWFMATGALQEEMGKRKSTLQAAESTISSITSTANHPNEIVHAKMDERIEELVNSVYLVWMEQFEKQQPILTWPDLGSDFISKVKELRPIEQKVPYPLEQEILSLTQRTTYRDFIQAELPKLADVIGAEWKASSTSSSRSGGGSGTMASTMTTMSLPPAGLAMPGAGAGGGRLSNEPQPIVVWNQSNQSSILQNRFEWSSRSNNVPSTLEVLYAQEDYWVLRAMMEIVRATNGDISHRYQAAIKTIDFIDFGSDAIGLAGEIKPIASGQQANAMGGALMAGQAPGADMAQAMAGMTDSMSGPTTTVTAPDPGDNRYVDPNFEPLPASRLRSASDSRNPEDAFLMVARRIPVRMRVKIDQRKLPKLLAECGNASPQLEVRQLRINMPSGSTAGQIKRGGGMGTMSLGGPGLGGLPGPGAAGAGAPMAPPPKPEDPLPAGGAAGTGGMGMLSIGGTGSGLSDESPYDVDAEIYGIMYIYNPVDMEKLGKKLEEPSAPEMAPSTEAAPPTAAAPSGEASPTAVAAG